MKQTHSQFEDDTLIANSLQALANHLAATHPVPPPAAILFRARRERHRLAVARATRPLRIVEGIALTAPVVLALWVLHQTLQVSAQSAASLFTPNLIALATVATVLLLAGSVTMLHLTRQR
jgi:hypothetical protein